MNDGYKFETQCLHAGQEPDPTTTARAVPIHRTSSYVFKNGFGGMVVFGIKGGLKAGQKFVDSLKLFSQLANVGDAKSLVLHPASTTHSQLSEEQQKAAGLMLDLIRLSIGLEHIDDIKRDLERAFAQT